MIEAIRTRLIDQVTDLTEDRVEGAIQFAELVEHGTLPSAPFFAYVIPTRMRGLDPSAMSGLFVQPRERRINVTIGYRAHSPQADRAIGAIDARVDQVIKAICGWGLDDAQGVFKLDSGQVVGFQKGAVIYALEFSITDQLRITS